MAETENNNAAAIDQLLAMADFLQANPEFPKLFITPNWPAVANAAVNDADQLARAMQMMGKSRKIENDFYFIVRKEFGIFAIDAYTTRQNVCEQVITTVQVPEMTIPAKEAQTIPAHEETKVTWKCPPSLLAMIEPDADPAKAQAVEDQGRKDITEEI